MSKKGAYYNEIDRFAADWLQRLIRGGLIADGDVDTRPIQDVAPGDLRGYTQCHFFAGIGGWSLALRLAGVSDDTPFWTGSCPCQPFSIANTTGTGHEDDRHLLSPFLDLIKECRPPRVVGEQVKNAIEWGWWDECCVGLEKEDYSLAAAVLPAFAFGADHERKRLYWTAYANGTGWKGPQLQQCLPIPKKEALPFDCDSFALARGVMEGCLFNVLPTHGVSIGVERSRIRGYGNAIVPQVAAQFIRALGI